MKASDPAFLFYSKDWVSRTSDLLHDEKGVFIDLLCYQHQNGNLPTDTKRLAKIVGMSHDDFLKCWEAVSLKYEPIATPNGERLVNRMLERVMQERSTKGEVNRISGTFASVLRKADLSKKEYNFVRNQFKIDDFKQIDSERLTERLTEWLYECLKSIANADANEDIILDSSEEKKQTKLTHPLQQYVIENLPRVSKLKKQLTYENCEELMKKYPKQKIEDTLLAMENYNKLNYVSVYMTVLNWLKKEEERNPTPPPKKELEPIPASYIFNRVEIDYGSYPKD